MNMLDTIKEAIDVAQRAQRNYDLSKSISDDVLDTLIYAAACSPSKQNETHYSLYVYTEQAIIKQIYDQTKKFSLIGKNPEDNKGLFEEKDGKFWQDENRSVKNSQILANVLFVYVEEEGPTRGGTHMLAKKHRNTSIDALYKEQKNFSIGISVGQLLLSAALLGFKTGVCSAMDTKKIAGIINTTQNPKLLVGIGYENIGIDRRLHAETLNRDIAPIYRTGAETEKWKFPSFEKTTKVLINGL
jgi:nitroreductase